MTQPTIPRELLTIPEAAHALGFGQTTIFDLLRRGELESIKVGRARRIPRAAIADFIARQRERP